MTAMQERIVAFDFDGTATDAEEEGRGFREYYNKLLIKLAGLTPDAFQAACDDALAAIKAHPGQYGWQVDGRIVAPVVDPYIERTVVAGIVLNAENVFMNERDRGRLLNLLFSESYAHATTCFRPGAAQMLRSSAARHATYVVTNVDTAGVQKKLSQLAAEEGGPIIDPSRVIGGARKMIMTNYHMPNGGVMFIPGLERRIYLGRGYYLNLLAKLAGARGLGWEQVVAVGDIAELELFPVYAMGGTVGLLANSRTPRWELDFFRRGDPRAKLLHTTAEVEDWIASL